MSTGENNTISERHRPFITLKNDSGSESTHYSVVYEGLPEEFKRVAERELNETEENRSRGLQKLKDYMQKKCTTVLEDFVLVAVLRGCKYDLKKSETKLEKFLAKRREIIEMVVDIDRNKIESIIDDFGFGILPYRDKHGRGIVYTRPYGMNEERYQVHDVMVMLAVSALFLMDFPISTVGGFAYYGECKSPNILIFYPILKSLKQIIFSLHAFPLRISRIEIMNENYLCRPFLKVISPFVSKKILSRISFHGLGYKNLHKLYDPKTLPDEFGGTMGPLSNTFYKQKLMDFIEDLKRERI